MRFVLLPLVDAHLPAPASEPRAPGHRPRNLEPAQLCLTPPDPKHPSLTSSPRNPRRFTYCAAISQVSTLNPGPNPTKRSTHNCTHRHPPILTNVRSRRPDPANTHPRLPAPTSTCRRLKSSVLRYLDFRPGLGPDLRDIAAQYSSDNRNPESQERDVVHEPVRCPAAPGMCAAILPVLAPDSSPGGRYRSTRPWTAGFAARMGEYCAAISGFWAPSPGAHPTKRSTLLPEGRPDMGAGRFEPGGRR